MSEWKKYRRRGEGEMRPVQPGETMEDLRAQGVSISHADESFPTREGDMVARNPDDHEDQWFVSKEYFEDHYEEVDDE